jgi:hypothetical protein
MRVSAVIFTYCLALQSAHAQADRDFAGIWRLNPSQSDIRDFSSPPARMLNLEQTAVSITVSASLEPGVPSTTLICPLDGSSRKNQLNDSTWNVVAKWEGTALLLNIIVSGSADYSLMERWTRSRDGRRLTITRNVIRAGGETESVFVYENSNVPVQPFTTPVPFESAPVSEQVRQLPAPGGPAQPSVYVVPAGTRILMRLTNAVNTKRTATGDRVYLQTAVPVFVNSRLIIPAGSYVTGTVTESQRAGRVKGRSALNLVFESVTLPNGVTRDFLGRAGSVDTQGNLDRAEGRIQGDGKAGSGARTVAQTTAVGTGIGTVAGAATGHLGTGMGVGAAAGAVAGLAGVFGSRGADVVVPQGTSIELVLDRELVFTGDDLRNRIQ